MERENGQEIRILHFLPPQSHPRHPNQQPPACPRVSPMFAVAKKSLASIHPPFPQKMAQPDSFPSRNSDHQVLFLQLL